MQSRKTDSLVEEYVTLLHTFDWYYAESKNTKEWQEGVIQRDAIQKVMTELYKRGITQHELKTIYNEYAPEDRFKYKGL